MRSALLIAFSLLLWSIYGCPARQDGTLEGIVTPPTSGANITVLKGSSEVRTIPTGSQNGKFMLALASGTYAIKVTTPGSPYPLRLENIVVKSGETTALPIISLAQLTGTGVLSGKLTPPRPDAEVKLLYEGKERAAVHVDRYGNYEFKEVPSGSYIVKTNAPGHADDTVPVVIADNQNVQQNTVLLPIASIEGVDWSAGKIRAVGIGIPPQNAANDTIRKELTKRAALVDAQRNMLRIIEQIRLDADQTIKTAMSDKRMAIRIEGFLKGYTIVSERELENGKFEIVLELPLTGPSGLTRYITE